MYWKQINTSCQAKQEYDGHIKEIRNSICQPIEIPQITFSIGQPICSHINMRISSKNVDILLTKKRQHCWRFPSIAIPCWDRIEILNRNIASRQWRWIYIYKAPIILQKARDSNKIYRAIYAWRKPPGKTRMEDHRHNKRLDADW